MTDTSNITPPSLSSLVAQPALPTAVPTDNLLSSSLQGADANRGDLAAEMQAGDASAQINQQALQQAPAPTPAVPADPTLPPQPPSPALDSSDLARRAASLVRLYPTLKGEGALVASLIALPVTDDELYANVGKTMTVAEASRQVVLLSDMEKADSRAAYARWQRFTPEFQQAIVSQGGTAPVAPAPGHKGFWDSLKGLIGGHATPSNATASAFGKIGQILGVASQGVHDVWGGVTAAATPLGLGGAARFVGRAPGDIMQFPGHIYRAATTNQPGDQGVIPGTGGAAFSWQNITSRSWEATSAGKPFFTNDAVAKAQAAAGGNKDLLKLAELTVNSGGDLAPAVQKMMGPAPTTANPAYKQRAMQLFALGQGNPAFDATVRALTGGGVSPGRDVARAAGLKEGSAPYNAVSGAGDALFQWYSNPLVLGGKITSAVRAARAIDPSTLSAAIDESRLPAAMPATAGPTTAPGYWARLAQLNLGSGVVAARRRLAVAITDHVNDGNASGLLAAKPTMAAGYQSFLDHVNSVVKPAAIEATGTPLTHASPNDFLDWMDSTAGGRDAIAKRSFGNYLTPNAVELPALSRTGALKTWAKVKATPLGTLAANPDIGLSTADLAPTQGWLAKTGSVLGSLPYKLHQLAATPIHDGQVVLAGDESLPSFRRYVGQYLLPSPRRDQLIDAFSNAPGAAARREVVAQTTEAGMRQFGFDSTEAGQQAMKSYVYNMRQAYEPNGRDMLPGGRGPASLDPELEDSMAVHAPGLRELFKAGNEANALGTVRRFMTNSTFETMMHRYWSPLALARVGFIPRVVSEEWMTALMRLQPGQVASGYAASALPRLADRIDAMGGDPAASPVGRFAQQLTGHALGLTQQMMLRHLDPAIVDAGYEMHGAQQAVKGARDASAELVRLAHTKARLASRLSMDAPEVAQAEALRQEGAARLKVAMERVARDPIVQRAYHRSLFATGGGYMSSVNVGGDLKAFDGGYEPVVSMPMSGTYAKYANGTLDAAPDPAYLTGAADYLGKFGMSNLRRTGLAAVMGYAPSSRQFGELRQVFNGSHLYGPQASDNDILRALRTEYSEAPPEVQQALRFHEKALRIGDPAAITGSGKNLYDLAQDSTVRTRRFLTGVVGKGNYRPIMRADVTEADALNPEETALMRSYRNARGQDKRAKIATVLQAQRTGTHGEDAAKMLVGRAVPDTPALSSEGLASLFVDPEAKILGARSEALEAARRAMLAHMHSPAFARHIPHADHIQDGLAEPVAAGRTRLYYPAAEPGWAPGPLNLDGIEDPRLAADMAATVLNRRALSQQVDSANEALTHQAIGAWGHTNPERAEAVAQHVAGDKAMVGYYDLPNEMLAAQDLSGPTADMAAHHPWHDDAVQAKALTEQVRRRMAEVMGEENVKGWRLSEAQQANGSVLTDDHTKLPDGTWANGHSLEDNLQRLAGHNAAALVDAFVPNGRMLHGVGADLLAQTPGDVHFTAANLAGVAPGDLPRTVVGPVETLSKVDSAGNTFGKVGAALDPAFTRFTRMFFDKGVGPAIDSMVRRPAFLINYAKAIHASSVVEPMLVDQELRTFGEQVASKAGVSASELRHAVDLTEEAAAKGAPLAPDSPESALLARAASGGVSAPERWNGDPEAALKAWSGMEDHVDDHLRQISIQRAIKDTLPFVNNHNARSNLTEWNRNTSPFLWAQESFLKRWSRALTYNPATFERLELGIHGMASMGVVHKDQYGQDSITFPASGALNALLGHLGIGYTLPKQIPFTMELRNITPGFAHPTLPAVGPLLTVPLGALSAGQPELNKIDQTLNQNHPTGLTGIVDQLFPATWARNMWQALTSSPNSQDFASAKLETMQMMSAAGLSPSDKATAAESQTYQNRLNTWVRNVMVLRGVLGFVSPGSMQFDPSGTHVAGSTVGAIHTDLQADIALLGPTAGVTEFMKQHPDASPYTVFPNTDAGSLAPPATQAADQMLTSNAGWFQAHPFAGAYFLPQAPGNFDRQAYLTETADGIRQRKGWDPLATEIATAAASQAYYPMHQQYLEALTSVQGDSAATTAVKKAWSTWDKNFQAAHPLFAQQLNSSTGQATRQKVIDDVRKAIEAGTTPNEQAATDLGGLIHMYDQWTEAHQYLATLNTAGATEQRKQVDASFSQMASSYLNVHPGAATFYQRIIVPDIANTDSTLGHILEAGTP